MHDLNREANRLDPDLAFSRSLLGKECSACKRAYRYNYFDHDSSSRDGYALICPECKRSPRLSSSEHVARKREENFASVSDQRRPNEEDYMDRESRGRVMLTTEFCHKLKEAGVKLVVGPAHFLEEVSLYVEDPTKENGFIYVGWLPTGYVQEFSEYEYNEYAVPTDELVHGYRGVLKNLIVNGYLTEKQCEKFFGVCNEKIWARAMWDLRNPQSLASSYWDK